MITFLFMNLRSGGGSTINSLHAARALAAGGIKVALTEPEWSRNPELIKYMPSGSNIRNNIAIYPKGTTVPNGYDVVLWDMGTVTASRITAFPEFDTAFLCCEAEAADLDRVTDFFVDVAGKNYYILLQNCSIPALNHFRSVKSKSYNIPRVINHTPEELVDILNQLITFKGFPGITLDYDTPLWEPLNDGQRTELSSETNDSDELPIPDEDIPNNIGDDLPLPGLHERSKDLINKPTVILTKEENDRQIEEIRKTHESGGYKDVVKNLTERTKDLTGKVKDKLVQAAENCREKKQNTAEIQTETDNTLKQQTSDVPVVDNDLPVPEVSAAVKTEADISDASSNKYTGAFSNFLRTVKHKASEILEVDEVVKIKEKKALSADIWKDSSSPIEKPKKTKEVKSNVSFVGHLSVFVTSLRHGAGTSYTSGSIGASLMSKNNTVCFVHYPSTNYPKTEYTTEYTGDDFSQAWNSKIVIYDRGCMGELSDSEMIELRRSDIPVLVSGSSESDIRLLARFIHKLESQNKAKDWLYVFNLIPSKDKLRKIKELMQEYDVVYLNMHDFEKPPTSIKSMWEKSIKNKLKK